MLDILLKRAVRSSDGEIRKLAWECLYQAAIAFDEQRGFLEKRLKEEGKSSPHLDLEIMQFSKRVQKDPETILREISEDMDRFGHEDFARVCRWVNVALAFLLITGFPVILCFLGGDRKSVV